MKSATLYIVLGGSLGGDFIFLRAVYQHRRSNVGLLQHYILVISLLLASPGPRQRWCMLYPAIVAIHDLCDIHSTILHRNQTPS